jgi:hypothetical protein
MILMQSSLPPKFRVRGKQYRIISTRYPPVNFFEKHVPPQLMGPLWELEAQTNPRMMQETGNLNLVSEQDYVSGPGASIVMAPFTHIGWATRFSDGTYGVYYAGRTLPTAIHETVHHKQIIAKDAQLDPDEFSLRVWVGAVRKSLHDIRGDNYADLHDSNPRPEDHHLAQAFGKTIRAEGSWGIIYRSVRHESGQCIAALRPPAISLPTQGAHLVYVWDGERISHVYEKSEPIMTFR